MEWYGRNALKLHYEIHFVDEWMILAFVQNWQISTKHEINLTTSLRRFSTILFKSFCWETLKKTGEKCRIVFNFGRDKPSLNQSLDFLFYFLSVRNLDFSTPQLKLEFPSTHVYAFGEYLPIWEISQTPTNDRILSPWKKEKVFPIHSQKSQSMIKC